MRIVVCQLPVKSPWLNRIEPHWIHAKRAVVEPAGLGDAEGRALFRGRERRDAARVSVGGEVGLRFGLRRKPATLLALSRCGAPLEIDCWLALTENQIGAHERR